MIKQSVIDDYNRRKLKNLVAEVSRGNGETSVEIISQYVEEILTLWSNKLQDAILCFEDLKRQCGDSSPGKVVKSYEPSRGHGAFKGYHEERERLANGEHVVTKGEDLQGKKP